MGHANEKIDLDQNGVFEDATESIVPDGGLQGAGTPERSTAYTLAAGNYNFEVSFLERGGGASIDAGYRIDGMATQYELGNPAGGIGLLAPADVRVVGGLVGGDLNNFALADALRIAPNAPGFPATEFCEVFNLHNSGGADFPNGEGAPGLGAAGASDDDDFLVVGRGHLVVPAGGGGGKGEVSVSLAGGAAGTFRLLGDDAAASARTGLDVGDVADPRARYTRVGRDDGRRYRWPGAPAQVAGFRRITDANFSGMQQLLRRQGAPRLAAARCALLSEGPNEVTGVRTLAAYRGRRNRRAHAVRRQLHQRRPRRSQIYCSDCIRAACRNKASAFSVFPHRRSSSARRKSNAGVDLEAPPMGNVRTLSIGRPVASRSVVPH